MLESERSRSSECHRYLLDVVQKEGLFAGRERMASSLEDLYVRRLRLPEGKVRADELRASIEDRDTVLIEMAHDGQLPHLGIVRLVLKARAMAESTPNGLALYFVGDHYSADMRPENLYLGLPLRGVDADHVKNPLTIPVGRRHRHIPFRRLPPPSRDSLDDLERRAGDWLSNNANHARRKAALPELRSALADQMELLRESARRTATFGDWLMRVQVLWLDALLGGPSHALAVLPMSGLVSWVPDVLDGIARLEGRVSEVKAEVSAEQRARGEAPHATAASNRGSFWVYCPSCDRRCGAVREDSGFVASCRACAKRVDAPWPEETSRVMPDIVAFELALFRMGIAGWVVGSRPPYHPVIERAYRALFGIPMPPKFFLTSIPRFLGVGEPEAGTPKARLFRVLLEMEPAAIRAALEGPWDANPRLTSRFR